LMPVALLAVLGIFAAGRWAAAGWCWALALATGLGMLAGHPQFVVYAGLASLAFALERAVTTRRPARLLAALGALLVAVAMGAAVWWPALLYSAQSVRGGGGVAFDEMARYSFGVGDLGALVWPWA